MDTALPQKFPFILDRNLAKANCIGKHVCTSCDIVVLVHNPYIVYPYSIITDYVTSPNAQTVDAKYHNDDMEWGDEYSYQHKHGVGKILMNIFKSSRMVTYYNGLHLRYGRYADSAGICLCCCVCLKWLQCRADYKGNMHTFFFIAQCTHSHAHV